MSISAAVVTTFPNHSWEIYSKAMLQSFSAYWPDEIPILVAVDDDKLVPDIDKLIREQDAISWKWLLEHQEFVDRNKDKDHPTDYRKQAVKFCHKVFAIKQALSAIEAMPESKPRYLIWMDADVITTRKVTVAEIEKCLPKEGDAIAYLGRKDWDHSECGWLVFDLENGGKKIINSVLIDYINDYVFNMDQWHDSWIWDQHIKLYEATDLTKDKPGMEIWPHSPMAAWSRHYKGPVAKSDLAGIPMKQQMRSGPIQIQTRNSIPDELIKKNIEENQKQIKQWVSECVSTDEEIIVVSAGGMLIPEDLEEEVKKGRKIVAVKHALDPLKEAGIKPWACILLDPREHLYKFVENPDKDMIWFVSSQVHPPVVKKLLDEGCIVWGYHASVGANETDLTDLQGYAVVHGGSATATRGLHLLNLLGFSRFKLYGYDLCFADKPNMDEKDEFGQPKYFEVSVESKNSYYKIKRAFWTKAELLAQYQEMNDLLTRMPWEINAVGHGIIPFLTDARRIGNLRAAKKKAKIQSRKPTNYEDLLNGRPDCRSACRKCECNTA